MSDDDRVVVKTVGLFDIFDRIHDRFVSCAAAFDDNYSVVFGQKLGKNVLGVADPLIGTENDDLLKTAFYKKLFNRMNDDRLVLECNILLGFFKVSHSAADTAGSNDCIYHKFHLMIELISFYFTISLTDCQLFIMLVRKRTVNP